MPHFKAAVPVTFALAMSMGAPTLGVASISDPSELMKPGSLRGLAGPGDAAIRNEVGGTQVDPGAKQKIACLQGYWRRC
jgi:hypothetical protein